MATYTDNYNLTKPTFAESADIRTINGNMDTIDAVMHASQVSLADAYDETRTASNPYNTGDIVMYELLMYKCLEDGVYGTWDGTKWERTTAGANGGGTNVVPNPEGEATDTLSTIGIGDTIFDIAGGGGGSVLTDDVIYEDTTGATGVQNITLTERLDKYDAIYFEFYFPKETTYVGANPSPLHRIVETPTGASNKYFVKSYPSYGNRYILLESSDGGTSATMTCSTWGEAIYPSVYKIHGVKFGGGSGGTTFNLVINQFDARITALEQALNSSGTRSLSLSKSAVNEEETNEEITEEPKEEEQNEDKR